MRRNFVFFSLLATTITATAAQAAAPVVYNGDKFYGINGPQYIQEVAHRLQVQSETTYVEAVKRSGFIEESGDVAMAAPYGAVTVKSVDAPSIQSIDLSEHNYQPNTISAAPVAAQSVGTNEVASQNTERSFLPSNLFEYKTKVSPTRQEVATGRTSGMISLINVDLSSNDKAEQPFDDNVSFIKPVFGEVLSHYGSKQNGKKNDGVNIAAPFGTPIRAAADGKVVYAGNELQGYGNMIIVRHKDGWMSAYAHADSIRVMTDQVIRQGDTLGTVGKTGNVETAQLHFGLRKGDTPVDPMSKVHTNYAAVR